MLQMSARWRQTIRRFRGLLLTGSLLALGMATGTDEARAQFLAQDFVSGNAQGATATGSLASSLGPAASAAGDFATAVGRGTQAIGDDSTAIGHNSVSSGTDSIGLGFFSSATGTGSMAIGVQSQATGVSDSTALGYLSAAIATSSTALGKSANASFTSSTALGFGSTTTRDFQMMFGKSDSTYTVPGVTSAASLAALSGSAQFVMTDADGNLALADPANSVGLGTFAPDVNTRLDIRSTGKLYGFLAKRTDANSHFARVENPAGVFRLGVQANGDAQVGSLTAGKQLSLLAGASTKMIVNATGQLSFGNPPPAIGADALTSSTGAVLTAAGVWTNNSSRAAKQDIEPITSEQARDTVLALQPVGYRYKSELDERYVGFIAEDVPELVATKGRKGLAPMDIVGVLTKVVQDQQTKLEKQEATITTLVERLEALERSHAAAAK